MSCQTLQSTPLPRGGGGGDGMSLGFGGNIVNPPFTQTGSFTTLLHFSWPGHLFNVLIMLFYMNFPVSCLKWAVTSRVTVTPRLVVVSKEGSLLDHTAPEKYIVKTYWRGFVKGILHPSAILMKLKGKRGSLPYSKLHWGNCWLLKNETSGQHGPPDQHAQWSLRVTEVSESTPVY